MLMFKDQTGGLQVRIASTGAKHSLQIWQKCGDEWRLYEHAADTASLGGIAR